MVEMTRDETGQLSKCFVKFYETLVEVGDAEYIMVILVLLFIIVALTWAVVHLYRAINKTIFRIEEKISDIDLIIHFATDNYLLNERKKQRDSGELAG